MPRGAQTLDFLTDSIVGDTAAYATGDQIGGVSSSTLQWLGAGGYQGAGRINQVVVTLETATAIEIDLILYNASFTAGTNNAAFTEDAADVAKSAGLVNIPAANFKSIGGNWKRATIPVADLIYKSTGDNGGILYGNLIARGALTLASATVYVALGVVRG